MYINTLSLLLATIKSLEELQVCLYCLTLQRKQLTLRVKEEESVSHIHTSDMWKAAEEGEGREALDWEMWPGPQLVPLNFLSQSFFI